MESRLSGLLEDMQKPLEEGMKVYKLYNDGFIVKTKSVTVAFDLYRGGAMKESPSLISDETMQAIVAQCDIMFLSHNHPDAYRSGCRKDVYGYGKTSDCPEQ